MDECKTEFSVEMKVTRLSESPRVPNPTEPWQQMNSLGRRSMPSCAPGCRLTMGENDLRQHRDRDGAEWNTIALGVRKRSLGHSLLKR